MQKRTNLSKVTFAILNPLTSSIIYVFFLPIFSFHDLMCIFDLFVLPVRV